MNQYLLAIDGGGTKCDAVTVRLDNGEIVGWGHCNPRTEGSGKGREGSGRSVQSARIAAQQALKSTQNGWLYTTNIHHEAWMPENTGMQLAGYVPTREYDSALALAGFRHGVVALAGTGAFIFARRKDGKSLMLDGLGPNLCDQGSGHHIGLMAIRAAAKSSWHPRHETSLDQRLRDYLGVESYRRDLGHILSGYMMAQPDRSEIAAIAKLVNEEAEKGDRIALGIIETAANALADTLSDVVYQLALSHQSYPLVGTGSVCVKSQLFWNAFCHAVKGIAPGLEPARTTLPAVYGVALRALEIMGQDIRPIREQWQAEESHLTQSLYGT
jgi:N-acetylglucosamine kinase-like BadF-type ATPase